MTTKFKIITGFVLMVVLLMMVATLGFRNLQGSSEYLLQYRNRTHVNIAMSDTMTAITASLYNVYGFLDDGSPSWVEKAEARAREADAMLQDAGQLIVMPEGRELHAALLKDLAEYTRLLPKLRDGLLAGRMAYDGPSTDAYTRVREVLVDLVRLGKEIKSTDMLAAIAEVWMPLARYRSSSGRLVLGRGGEDGKATITHVEATVKAIEALGNTMQIEQVLSTKAELLRDTTILRTEVQTMVSKFAAVENDVAKLVELADRMSSKANRLNSLLAETMRTIGTEASEHASSAQRYMLGIGIAGVIAAALLAALIIVGLVRVLTRVSAFAESVAKGDFSGQLDVRERGEIGAMVAALRAIPDVLKQVLAEYRSLEDEIELGMLDAQGNESRYKGDFATLVRGTNAVLTRFRMVIDNIPSPVLMMNRELQLQYMNTAGRELAGSDYRGKEQLFKREDEGPNDAVHKAIEGKRRASAETRSHPGGKNLDISYTAIPMLNAQGSLASVLQLITDLTDIKNQQRTMLKVAKDATEISDRVAAASEELSAQVEEVSHGAEMQRSRVESTASAMAEMNSTVLEVARNAGQASEQSETTRVKAEEGAQLVNNVVKAINTVNTVAVGLQNNMQELGKQAENIGGVMNVISDIADQTNLLALNAAIEAARAGEAGRGFAVVADEVRKLAEKTMSATQEVGSSISAIQHSARNNIDEVGNAVRNVTEATNLANSSGLELKEIVDLASANSSVVASIATAAEEQSATSEEINRAIEEINRVVADTAEGMVQSAAAVQDLSNTAQELRRVMEGLRT
jgi:methyl-accepting chemotaxis protein